MNIINPFFAAPPIDPVTGMYVWLKYDAGVHLDGASECIQWDDQSGNGQNFVKHISGSGPLWDGATSLVFRHGDYLRRTYSTPVSAVFSYYMVFSVYNTDIGELIMPYGMNSQGPGIKVFDNKLFLSDSPHYYDKVIPFVKKVFCYENDGTNSKIWENGVCKLTEDSEYITTHANGLLNAASNLYWNGQMSELILYNSILSSSDREHNEIYLSNKYGL